MGSSGWSIAIASVPGAMQARRMEVYSGAAEVIREFWWQTLDGRWRSTACDWISSGIDSLLTVGDGDGDGPIQQVTFWFNETVWWPHALADHWLRIALVCSKLELDDVLRKCGYTLVFAGVPSTLDVSRVRFFVHEGRIGTASRDRIDWQDEESAPGEYGELADDVRRVIDRVLATRCRCPLCVNCSLPTSDDIGARGAMIELLDLNGSPEDLSRIHELVVDGDAIVTTVGRDGTSWAWLRRAGGTWTRDAAVARGSQRTQWLARDPRDGVWVTHIHNGPTLVSADGRTWEASDSRGLPGEAWTSGQGAEICAVLRPRVFRSSDAGRSFEELPPLERVSQVFAGSRVVAFAGASALERDGVFLLEAGAWAPLALPNYLEPEQVLFDGDAILLFGSVERGKARGASVLRLIDGHTFSTVHPGLGDGHLCAARGPDGLWWWSVIADSDSEAGLFVAASIEGPWRPVASLSPTEIFPDPTVPTAAWIADYTALYRVMLD